MSGNIWNSLLVAPTMLSTLLLVVSSATAAENSAVILENQSQTATTPILNSQSPDRAMSAIANPNILAANQVPEPRAFSPNSTLKTTSTHFKLASDLDPTPSQTLPATTLNQAPNSEQVNGFGEASEPEDPMGQITNVSQLTDVKPSDWAYGALRDLVERYGCIAGYPDGFFRGNRALSRYEFAAGLNACLKQMERLLPATSNFATQQDLEKLRRLAQEFQGELATLRGRVDGLEARVTELETNQFSVTTKLNGLAWFNVTGAFAGNVKREGVPGAVVVDGTGLFAAAARVEPGTGAGPNKDTATSFASNPGVTMSGLAWLTLATSFTGKDVLFTQLAGGNGLSPANLFFSAGNFNNSGVPFLDQTSGSTNGVSNVIIRELSYTFPLTNNLQLTFGPRINQFRYFDDNRFTFFLNGASSFQSNGSALNDNIKRGAGAVLQWQLSNQVALKLGYLGESNEFNPSPSALTPATGRGLFGGTNQAIAELDYAPSSSLNLRFYYARNNLETNTLNTNFTSGINRLGGYASIQGVVDAGSGCGIGITAACNVNNATADILLFNFDWLLAKNFGLFGRYTFATHQITPSNTALSAGNLNVQSFQVGLAFPDLGKEGAMGTLSLVVPYNYTAGQRFLVSGAGDGGTQYDVEATYAYPVSNSIDIVPSFYAIFNPNNFSSNPAIYVGTLRTQFKF